MEQWLLRMETFFWDSIIQLLSRSQLVRKSFIGGYRLVKRREGLLTTLFMVFCTASGVVSGCVFYMFALGQH